MQCCVCVEYIFWINNNVRDFVPYKECPKEQSMSSLVHINRCNDIIHVGLKTFINICQRLKAIGLVKDVIHYILEKQVAKFLHIIGHNVKNHKVSFFFII